MDTCNSVYIIFMISVDRLTGQLCCSLQDHRCYQHHENRQGLHLYHPSAMIRKSAVDEMHACTCGSGRTH